jgi:hypothetical protein
VASLASLSVAARDAPSVASWGLPRESVVVGLLALAVLAAHTLAGRVGLDLVDEGYFLSLADRVRQGAVPYRDFDTYYTPGVFYLYAALFDVFGVSVGTIRGMIAVEWAAYWLVLYSLARRVVAPAFAVLPFLLVAVVEPSPLWPAAHPGWLALLAALLALEAVARHQQSGRTVWLALAGAAAAVGIVFKQNVGAFAALAVAGYVVLRPRESSGRVLRAVRVVFAGALTMAVADLMRPGFDALVAATLLAPLVVILLLLLATSEAASAHGDWTGGLRRVAAEGALVGGAVACVTILWLVPLIATLGVAHTPFELFLGGVRQQALLTPLVPPRRSAQLVAWLAIWLPLVLAAVARPVSTRRWARWLAAALGASALVLWLPIQDEIIAPAAAPADVDPLMIMMQSEYIWLYLYAPAACAWGALMALAWDGRMRAMAYGPIPWYLLFGILAALALYPRMDHLHVMMAGPTLFVAGAWALARVHGALTDGAGRVLQALVFVSLLIFPVVAAVPLLYMRYAAIARVDYLKLEPATYVPLGLERADVLVQPRNVVELGGAVRYIQEHTAPGEPLLAYPMLPMFNFLADRPNHARINHFLPGVLTAQDMANVIASLEARPPRFVVWDHAGVLVWETDHANRALSDYIWRCYAQVESFGLLLVLERTGC